MPIRRRTGREDGSATSVLMPFTYSSMSGFRSLRSTPRCAQWWKAGNSMTIAMRLCGSRMAQPARWLSQVAAGELNDVRLRVYGEKGSIDWRQQDPNRLIVKLLDGPEEIHHAAASYLGQDAKAVMRIPRASGGIYRGLRGAVQGVCRCLTAWKRGSRTRCRPRFPDCRRRTRNEVHRARNREQPQGRLG